ncbi:S-protein homolog 8 [Linum grandiflorum]
MTSKTLSLVLVVATLLLSTTIPPSSASWFHRPRYYVHVVNELTHNEVLFVACTCTDAPQPTSFLNAGSEYEWSFKEHLFRMTLWTCYLSPDNSRHLLFHAYEKHQPNYNKHVYWVAKEDGVYSRFPDLGDQLQFPWQPSGVFEVAY